MYILFQYPLVDFRPVSSAAKAKLTIPTWPTPQLQYRPFIRHFGAAAKRKKGGITEWVGEDHFCNAHRSIRYHDLHKQVFTIENDINLESINSTKRLFSDGKFMNKVEVCLENDIEHILLKKAPATQVSMVRLLRHYAELPVRVNGTSTKLFKAGKLLAKLYCDASCLHSKPKEDYTSYVSYGQMCMLVIYSDMDQLQLPAEARKINEYPTDDGSVSIPLYGYTLHIEGYDLKVWMIKVPYFKPESQKQLSAVLRNLRIVLMRMHAEKETINALLNAIKRNKIEISDTGPEQLLMKYLKASYEELFKKRRFKIDQKDMLNFALQSEDAESPATLATLQKSIKDAFMLKNMSRFLEAKNPEDKKVILFVCSSPQDKNDIKFGPHFNAIRDSLERSADRFNYVPPEIELSVKRADFGRILDKYRPDILHICMHASPHGLYFEDTNGYESPMSPQELADLLATQEKIHRPGLVVLSACNTKSHAEAIGKYCDCVIATNEVFPARAGALYANAFYSMLFNDDNTPIETCHEAGVHAIKYAEEPFAPRNGVEVSDMLAVYR